MRRLYGRLDTGIIGAAVGLVRVTVVGLVRVTVVGLVRVTEATVI